MILLFITLLAWAILSIGIFAIDWGYAALSQARIYAATQTLALDALSRDRTGRFQGKAVFQVIGLDAHSRVEKTVSGTHTAQLRITTDITFPA